MNSTLDTSDAVAQGAHGEVFLTHFWSKSISAVEIIGMLGDGLYL